jgi:hypothetical protein
LGELRDATHRAATEMWRRLIGRIAGPEGRYRVSLELTRERLMTCRQVAQT